MVRFTVVPWCVVFFATAVHLGSAKPFVDEVKKFKSLANSTIQSEIVSVTEAMEQLSAPDSNTLVAELHDQTVIFITDSYQKVINVGSMIEEYVTRANNEIDNTELLKCYKMIDDLHRLAENVISSVKICSWRRLGAIIFLPESPVKVRERYFNETIGKLKRLKERLDTCDDLVRIPSDAYDAIACIKSAETAAAWVSVKFSIELLTSTKENRIQQIITDCLMDNALPSGLDPQIDRTLAQCNGSSKSGLNTDNRIETQLLGQL